MAIVAGVGVWTTHFVAMIGYRPDAALTYEFRTTAISILVGIVGVGLPIAAALFLTSRVQRIALGVTAGLGVTAMHLAGMSALENCLTTYNPVILILGILAGIGGFVFSLVQESSTAGDNFKRVAGFVAGVCGLHFIAMGSVIITPFPSEASGIGGSFLSILVAVVSLGVLAFAVVATFNYRRSLALLRLSA
ncbi:MHYT domain-containing protein [Pseudooceanicola sp. C21-150M6]|uniref:MHYT domain-containing protein n=1 Tax=Pseudooceanicola sp. C21-150M6 TaxID=3434355 RepID=UPI003D7FD8CE